MTKILHITASIRGDQSVSRQLSTELATGLAAKHGANITVRNLAANDLPYIDEARFAANLTSPAERSPEQQKLATIGDELIAELQAADIIVMGVPMYNFAMPGTVKNWADLVARAGTTFRYTPDGSEGLLKGKQAYLAVATGGAPVGGPADFLTPWLKQFLGFLGIPVTDMVYADGIMGEGGEAKVKAAREEVAKIIA